jgi:CubicO group peptidase (beta-lactamase class C family)
MDDQVWLLITIALSFLLTSCVNPTVSPAPTAEPEPVLEEKVDRYTQSLPDPFSGTVLMAVGDEILLNKGYSLANRSYNIPNDSKTKYSVGSITKSFTAVLVLQMVEKGLIDLNATIDTYLPYYPQETASKITIHHLLSHTSGVPHHFVGIQDYFLIRDQVFHTPREYLELFWDADLVHEPGQRVTYSSPGYYLLGVILETVTNQSYAELLEENIFEPLRMGNTSVDNNLTIQENMAIGYMKGLNGYVHAPLENESNRLAGGNLVSTAEDLYLFQKVWSFEGDNILSEEYKGLLLSSHPPNHDGYGVSRQIISYNNGQDKLKIASHGGSSYGFRASLVRIIEKDACVIVLSNVQSDWAMTLETTDHIRDLLLEELGIALSEQASESGRPTPVAIALAVLAAYEGLYEFDDGGIAAIFHQDNKLVELHGSSQQIGPFGTGVSRRELIPRDENLFDIDGERELQYRFIKESDEYTIEVLRNGVLRTTAESLKCSPDVNLAEYQGEYYSVELQRTYRFFAEDGCLSTSTFLGAENPVFVPLEEDLFGFERGFLFFHRYAGGEIRDFRLETDYVDHNLGSIFIKK